VKVSCESATVDVKIAKEFLETEDELIMEENYFPEQIFSINETCLHKHRFPFLRMYSCY
jgi:hypothetical protein